MFTKKSITYTIVNFYTFGFAADKAQKADQFVVKLERAIVPCLIYVIDEKIELFWIEACGGYTDYCVQVVDY
jgi:hypothetical protein